VTLGIWEKRRGCDQVKLGSEKIWRGLKISTGKEKNYIFAIRSEWGEGKFHKEEERKRFRPTSESIEIV